LTDLGTTGIEAVGYLSSGLPASAGWKTEKLALLDTAEKPQALVRFTMIRPLRDLVNAVSESTAK
jgi:hexosaminidase